MEILSTGEKIKRARVYKGYTLKKLCDDKISVSKMSCIENGKVQPEEWILEFISKKLDIDFSYLIEDIESQINNNIQHLIQNPDSSEYEENVKYYLEYAEKYKLSYLSLKLMHLLFNYYIKKRKLENLQVIDLKYSNLCQFNYSENNQIIYFLDKAKYLYLRKEYMQAVTYYKNVRETLLQNEHLDKDGYKNLLECYYHESVCFVMTKEYSKAYDLAINMIDFIEQLDDCLRKADIYHLLAVLSLRNQVSGFEEYEKLSNEIYGENYVKIAKATNNYGELFLEIGNLEKGLEYIKKAINVYPPNKVDGCINFMLGGLQSLIEHGAVEEAQFLCDRVLNKAIEADNIRCIEEAYYYKAVILEKSSSNEAAEMYMNLSLDALLKFGNKKEVYDRYINMGNMYFKFGNTSEALKYFDLALKIEKKL